MTKTIQAIFEKGALRPIQPLDLEEGEKVELTIVSASPAPDPRKAAQLIAARPMQPGGLTFNGRDHDQILYGDKGAR